MALRIADQPTRARPSAAARAGSAADRREAPYRARRAAIEARLGRRATAAPRELPGLYLAVAREALDGLAAEPREPVLLNYAGVGLYELGAREAAAAALRGRAATRPRAPARRRATSTQARRRARASRPPCPPRVAARAARPRAPAARRVAARRPPRHRPARSASA